LPRLSAIIITLNEAGNIAGCLDTLAFCDERIVIDGGSADETVQIALAKGARVTTHPFEGFGAQKGFALSLATGEWVLSIDADERVPPKLAQEIQRAVAAGNADCYEMPRQSTFCGRLMGHAGWSTDHVLRLFRRDKAYFSADLVHERVVGSGTIARLDTPLMHDPVHRLEDALSRMDRYSTAGAEQLVAAGKRVSFMSGISHGLWAFVRLYLLRGGFLDGREGFLLAVANAEGTYYRYMKAWLMGRKR
jgi:glycosyltransferase involved in cell wall biosynthesis